MDASNPQARARVAKSVQKSAAADQEGSPCRLTLRYRCHEWPCEWYPLSAGPSLCFVFRCCSRFTLVCLLFIYQGIRLLLWFQGTAFPPPFFVRAFCMKLLNSIHDEIGNRSLACWFCFDCLKSPYKPTVQKVCTRVTVGKRFAVCSGAKTICIALARHRNYRQVLYLRSRCRRKTKNRLPPKTLPAYGNTAPPVSAKKNVTDNHPEISNIPSVFLFGGMLMNDKR